jgi:hypothetical protein
MRLILDVATLLSLYSDEWTTILPITSIENGYSTGLRLLRSRRSVEYHSDLMIIRISKREYLSISDQNR